MKMIKKGIIVGININNKNNFFFWRFAIFAPRKIK